jgi:hypothetical protein
MISTLLLNAVLAACHINVQQQLLLAWHGLAMLKIQQRNEDQQHPVQERERCYILTRKSMPGGGMLSTQSNTKETHGTPRGNALS